MKLISLNIKSIAALCKKYRVRNLYVFGSILTDKFNDNSDVDLSFNFEQDVTYNNYFDNFYGLYQDLKSLLGREIDLVDESAIKNKYFKQELEEKKQLIYG